MKKSVIARTSLLLPSRSANQRRNPHHHKINPNWLKINKYKFKGCFENVKLHRLTTTKMKRKSRNLTRRRFWKELMFWR